MEENTFLNNSFSILIPDGESPLTISVVRCLSEVPGIKINILSRNRFSLVRFSRYINSFHYENTTDEDLKIDSIKRIVKATNSDIILPVDVPTIKLLTTHKNKIGNSVLLPDSDALTIASDKWLLSKFLSENKLPQPATIFFQNLNGLDELSEMEFPVLVKPTKGLFGRGIKLFSNPTELKDHLNSCEDSEEYVIQSFVKGFDIDCSVLCKEGEILNFTIQKEIYPSNNKFGSPAAIEFLYEDNVFDIVKNLIQKLNWSGVAHIDLRYDESENQFKIIEVNPRFWGSLLGSLHAGVNFPYLACLVGFRMESEQIKFNSKKFSLIQEWVILFAKRRFKGKNFNISFRETNLKYILKDPFPEMLGFNIFLYKKVFYKIKRIFRLLKFGKYR